ncbi:MAG: hypothetical protein GC168_08610 [Candidatus Hydrogenedens sp.]|nr:hypothetical protein [Candidatus Hydrogenedens sp.]
MNDIPVREHLQSKAEIQAALRAAVGGVADWISAQPDAQFEYAPEGRWTMGQHLEHLVRSIKPLTSALRAPKFVLKLVLAKPRRKGMSYVEVRTRYEGVLDEGGKASGKFLPPPVTLSRKAELLKALRKEGDNLARQLDGWSEADLDAVGAKHPLIGLMSLRELLFFTVHHHDHHLNTLQRDYAG